MRMTILAALALAIPTVVVADEIADAVKARQDHFKARGQAIGVLAAMAKGEAEYDAAKAQEAADKLVELANEDISGLWPAGSSSEDLPGVSRALPAIWMEGSKVGEIGAKFAPAAEALQEAAGQGKAEMAGALGGVGQVCQECHKSYQQEKK